MNKELPQNLSYITHLNNIDYFTSTSKVSNLPKAAMKQSLRQAYSSIWKSKIYETPKGSFLAEIDEDFAYETYLDCPIRKARILTTKLRTSDHNLAIEKRVDIQDPLSSERNDYVNFATLVPSKANSRAPPPPHNEFTC